MVIIGAVWTAPKLCAVTLVAANIKTDRPADIADRTTDYLNMVMNAFGLSPK